ncbi:MAG: methyltransferase [Sandaracinaceae bacterium]
MRAPEAPSSLERDLGARLEEVAALLAELRDVVEERVLSPVPPAWCTARGWTPYLSQLRDDQLAEAELDAARVFAGDERAPCSLRRLAERVADLRALPGYEPGEDAGQRALELDPRLFGARARKRAQVTTLTAIALDSAHDAERIVDFGSGRAHLTRFLAGSFAKPAVGLEQRPAAVAAARRLDERAAVDVRYEQRDARDETVALAPRDLLVGLHACGALGDALIAAARRSGCAAMLVSCCPQKIEGETREPLSTHGARLGLRIPRRVLGLANLGALDHSLRANARAAEQRRLRHGLRLLLTDALGELEEGAESRGLNRRRFRGELARVAHTAFVARGLPVPTQQAIEAADRAARAEHAVIRRLALPRTMLARVVELAVVLDRARALEERGHEACVLEAFPAFVSPRNLVVIARPPSSGPRPPLPIATAHG